MVYEARAIEVTVVSATDLKKVKKFKQQRCYAVAYIYAAQRQASLADPTGGVNPTWNAHMTLSCYETDLYPDGSSGRASSSSSSFRAITVDIYSHSSGFFTRGDKLVGTVVVPLQHIASVVQVEGLAMMAFDVRRPSGKVQGKLNLALKLGEKGPITGDQQQMPSYAYHRYKVETSPMMPPMGTSYNIASSTLSTQGAYIPSVNTFGKQKVVTGYPTTNHGFAPLDPHVATNQQEVGYKPYINETYGSSPRERKRACCAKRVGNRFSRKARRGKRLTTVALLVGGIVLGLLLL